MNWNKIWQYIVWGTESRERTGPKVGREPEENCLEEVPPAKKFELTDTFLEFSGLKFYQIKALRDLNRYVKKGDLGGYVLNEHCLDHGGGSWVYPKEIRQDGHHGHDELIRPDRCPPPSSVGARFYIYSSLGLHYLAYENAHVTPVEGGEVLRIFPTCTKKEFKWARTDAFCELAADIGIKVGGRRPASVDTTRYNRADLRNLAPANAERSFDHLMSYANVLFYTMRKMLDDMRPLSGDEYNENFRGYVVYFIERVKLTLIAGNPPKATKVYLVDELNACREYLLKRMFAVFQDDWIHYMGNPLEPWLAVGPLRLEYPLPEGGARILEFDGFDEDFINSLTEQESHED
jgi:hypothetical protein